MGHSRECTYEHYKSYIYYRSDTITYTNVVHLGLTVFRKCGKIYKTSRKIPRKIVGKSAWTLVQTQWSSAKIYMFITVKEWKPRKISGEISGKFHEFRKFAKIFSGNFHENSRKIPWKSWCFLEGHTLLQRENLAFHVYKSKGNWRKLPGKF